MNKIKLIIEIPEEYYKVLMDSATYIEEIGGVLQDATKWGIPEDDFSEIVKRPVNVRWSYSPNTTDLTCPICREVSKRSLFNRFCPSCGAGMVEEPKNESD